MNTVNFCIHPRSQTLLRWMVSNPLPGPMLITGVSGMGKRTLALLLAQRALCHQGLTTACECASCVAIKQETNGDCIVVNEEGPLSIETIRTIRSQISHTSFNPRGRVVILLHSERLTHEASNALLKRIEEPGADTKWILTALHSKQLPSTLLSRLYRLRLSRVPTPTIVQWSSSVLQSSCTPELLQQAAGRPGVLQNLCKQSTRMQQRQELMDSIEQAVWYDGGMPILEKDSIPSTEIVNELFERLQQEARTPAITWSAWLQRVRLLEESKEALLRHQSIDQVVRYVSSQQTSS